MESPRIVGFAGKAGTGKSTAAHMLTGHIKSTGRTAMAVSFTSPIKTMIMSMLVDSMSMSDADAMKYLFENKEVEIPHLGVSSRTLVQTLGTEWGRVAVNPNLWINVAQGFIETWAADIVWVFDDVRYQNEVDWIKSYGNGHVIYLTRKDKKTVAEHISESQELSYDFLYANDQDPVAMRRAVEALWKSVNE